VRAACLLAFDERLPRLEELADSEDASVSLKALDMLAKYGALNFTESAARVELDAPRAIVRTYLLPSNGRQPSLDREPAEPEPPRRRAAGARPEANGRARVDDDLPPGTYRWRDGTLMAFPEDDQ
jgi:hypothetical protein